MVRIGTRATIGLLFALVLVILLAPRLWAAGAPTRALGGDAGSQILFPTIPTVRITTTTSPAKTTPANTTPSSTPGSPTPTTRTPSTRPRVTVTTTSTTTGPTTTTSTTLAPLPAPAPAPVTLPLATASQSGSVSALFPVLSGIGFVALIGLLTAQWFLTKPGRRGPTL